MRCSESKGKMFHRGNLRVILKRPMGHIAHLETFLVINKVMRSYDFTSICMLKNYIPIKDKYE